VASSNLSLLGHPLVEPLIANGATGFRRGHGKVVVAELVPSANWRTVFRQDASEFDGALTGPLHSALVYIVLAGVLAAIAAIVLLGRRLRRAREEQRRLEEISAVREEFISIVSHELRTPVAGLLGFIQTTLDHWDGMTEEERRRALGRSLASARRLHALTRDVLTTSSVEAGAMPYAFTVVDMRHEIASATGALRDLMPDRLITVSVGDDPAWVRVDPERLQQVLTNLLDNALKSSPPMSPVEVSMTVVDQSVHVTVTDRGPGLSEHELTRVFEKFVRGRTSTTAGTGLGLYICRQVVEAHGGRIYAKSSVGGGAAFVFELPLVAAPAEPVDA
jgi:two-component system sensor histidine kinase KdpD